MENIIQVNCPRCGSKIVVDREKDTTVCPNCKVSFLTEDVLKKYEIPNISCVYAAPNVSKKKRGFFSRLFKNEDGMK